MDDANKYQTPLKLTSTKLNSRRVTTCTQKAAYTLTCQRREYLKMLKSAIKT